MSVSALDKPIHNPPSRTPLPEAEHNVKHARSSADGGQNAGRVSFGSGNKNTGQIDPGQTSPTKAGNNADLTQDSRQSVTSDAQPSGLLNRCKQKWKGWCGGNQPPNPHPCPPPPCYVKPPEPPKPCRPERPEPCRYERNDKLLGQLKGLFGEFQELSNKSYITDKDIQKMANEPFGQSDKKDQSIYLARALLKHPELINAIDRHSTTGALDGIIDMAKIEMTLQSKSPYKYFDDKYLADEISKHFDEFTSMKSSDYISIRKLKRIAEQSTDDPDRGHLAWMAQELLKRSETLEGLDGDDYWGKDDWIHKDALLRMAH